jgi:NAD(P)H-hydrate epimerase
MAALDRATIEGRGIPSLKLMERAGKGCARAIAQWWKKSGRLGSVLILSGRGNNGGDGLVVARHLKAAGFVARVIVASDEASLSVDARANYEACAKARVPVTFLPDPRGWGPGSEAADAAAKAALLIDALLGTGSKGPPRGAIAAAIELATASGKPIASIDIPSGVDASNGHVEIPAIRADFTVTIALSKVGLAMEPGREQAGLVEVVDIGIPSDLIEGTQPGLVVADGAWAHSLLPHRPSDAHKGSVGRVLIVERVRGTCASTDARPIGRDPTLW